MSNTTKSKFAVGQQVFVTVFDGDTHEHVEVRGLILKDGVRILDLRTGTVITTRADDSTMRVRNEPRRKVWTCTVAGTDIFAEL